MRIELNNGCRRDIRIVGDERTPIITLDEPILSIDELSRHARLDAAFGSGGQSAYPGIRAELPAEYSEILVPQLVALISHVYRVPRSYKPRLVHQLFSLVTLQPEHLGPLQRMPHTDNRSPWYFASVHYLNPGDHGGTGFFRHRPTSFERISEDRYSSYVDAANAHMAANGPPPEKYIDASDGHFELIAEVEHQPNRMAVYPGNLLHSGLIKPDRDIDPDPAGGRLTANLFLLFTPP